MLEARSDLFDLLDIEASHAPKTKEHHRRVGQLVQPSPDCFPPIPIKAGMREALVIDHGSDRVKWRDTINPRQGAYGLMLQLEEGVHDDSSGVPKPAGELQVSSITSGLVAVEDCPWKGGHGQGKGTAGQGQIRVGDEELALQLGVSDGEVKDEIEETGARSEVNVGREGEIVGSVHQGSAEEVEEEGEGSGGAGQQLLEEGADVREVRLDEGNDEVLDGAGKMRERRGSWGEGEEGETGEGRDEGGDVGVEVGVEGSRHYEECDGEFQFRVLV
ncbi:hypothetical protein MLD38_003946 [Melastoma candidum]|uniref:Uncharacterized protein n=1 Tax=Melastoma candidum TaxID=119954 RepID=A0ACB9S3U8_9MYRT|nr:hypothetical protein MLD38_003946 [Melastoma candidum]